MLCHTTPCHARPCRTIRCHASPTLAIQCHTMSLHAVPCHVTPCHHMARRAMHMCPHLRAGTRPCPDLGRVGFAISDRGHNYIRSSRASNPRRTRLWRRLLCHRRCRRSRRRANPRSRRSARACVCASARACACARVRVCALPIATVECKAKVRAYFLDGLAGWLQFG